MGIQRIVRVMEVLGTTMVEMRHAPDARLLLEVAVVQLASPVFDDSNENLLARISQLEEAVKTLRENGVAAAMPQAPINPSTGRAKIGGHASGSATSETPRPAPDALPEQNTVSTQAPDVTVPTPATAGADQTPTAGVPVVAEATQVPAVTANATDPAQVWPQITEAMRGLAKAMFKPAVIESVDGKKVVLRLPNNTPMKRAQEQLPTVVAAMKQVCGTTFAITLVQADATSPGGMTRPVIAEPEVTNIVDEVASDPYAEIDLAETTSAVDAVDPFLAALHNTFPEGSIVDDVASTDSPRGKK
jgi:DNA polymerase-3 subunit gamma/tau